MIIPITAHPIHVCAHRYQQWAEPPRLMSYMHADYTGSEMGSLIVNLLMMTYKDLLQSQTWRVKTSGLPNQFTQGGLQDVNNSK